MKIPVWMLVVVLSAITLLSGCEEDKSHFGKNQVREKMKRDDPFSEIVPSDLTYFITPWWSRSVVRFVDKEYGYVVYTTSDGICVVPLTEKK